MGELAAVLLGSHALNVLADLVRAGELTIEELLRVAAHMGEDGEHLVALIQSARPEDLAARSNNERTLFHALVKAGVEPPLVNHKLITPWRPIEMDNAWLERKVNVEIDGPHHEQLEQQSRDETRDGVLHDLGWHVERIPATRVRRDLDSVVHQVREILEQHPPTTTTHNPPRSDVAYEG